MCKPAHRIGIEMLLAQLHHELACPGGLMDLFLRGYEMFIQHAALGVLVESRGEEALDDLDVLSTMEMTDEDVQRIFNRVHSNLTRELATSMRAGVLQPQDLHLLMLCIASAIWLEWDNVSPYGSEATGGYSAEEIEAEGEDPHAQRPATIADVLRWYADKTEENLRSVDPDKTAEQEIQERYEESLVKLGAMGDGQSVDRLVEDMLKGLNLEVLPEEPEEPQNEEG